MTIGGCRTRTASRMLDDAGATMRGVAAIDVVGDTAQPL
jgi:hypothetical protein